MKLLERYATVCRANIGRQWLLESFYPIPITRYITLQASSGMAGKNYPHYNEVVRLLGHILNSQGIQIVQLGGKDDQAVPGCVHLQGKTSFHQANYILKGSMLHLGNDSWLAHRAGELSLPLITLFGATSAANHGAYEYDPAKTVFIESHRCGKQPTFAIQENPATIAFIPPERVANEALRLLGIQHVFAHQSRFWGLLHQHLILDLIPNAVIAPTLFPEAPVNIRMDYLHDETVLAAVLGTGRRINLITNRPIQQVALLANHRGQILSYNHEIGARGPGGESCPEDYYPSPAYIGTIKTLIPQHAFFTKESDPKVLADLRFRYLDECFIEQTKDTSKADYISATLVYLNRPDTPENRLALEDEVRDNGTRAGTLMFRSGKIIFSVDKAYLSLAHVNANQPIKSLNDNVAPVLDDPLCWRELNHFQVYYQPVQSTL